MSLRETIPLQFIKIMKKSIGLILLIPVLACMMWALFIPTANFDNPLIARAVQLLFIVTFFGIPIYQYLYFKAYYYDISDSMLTIRKGVVTPKEITLPFSRITDVYIDQDFLDVVFGICDVHVSTPTAASGLFAHIDGVSKSDGEKLKKLILGYLNKQSS